MNAWQQVTWIASEALSYLEDSLVISQLTAKDLTAEFNRTPDGYTKGDSINIKTNPVYEAKSFAGSIVRQGIRSSKRSLTIEEHFDVSVGMTAREKALDMGDFSNEVIKPAAYALAEKCDRYVGTKILEGAGIFHDATMFNDAASLAQAKKSSTFQQLSSTGRFCLMNDTLEASLLGSSFFSGYNQRGESGERVFNEGSLGAAMGMSFFSSLNFPVSGTHAIGDGVGVSKTSPTGTENLVGTSSLVLQAAATGTFNAGDRIIVAGMRRPLIVSGTQATPSAIALVDPIAEIVPVTAAVTVVAAADYDVVGAIFDDKTIAIASPMLDPASSLPSSVVSNNGYSIRVVQGYDIDAKTETISFDILMGATAHDPRRITLLGE